jgi:hypothetical protein
VGTYSWDDATQTVRRLPDPLPPKTDYEVISAWRVMFAKPRDDVPTLYSPMYGHKARGGLPTSFIRSPRQQATCPTAHHVPPSEGCKCGIYAEHHVIAALYRYRAAVDNIRRDDWYWSWNPLDPAGKVPVLLQVKMHNASWIDDQGLWAPLARVRDNIATNVPVLRAAEIEITRMFVTTELLSAEAATALVERLALSFGIPATIGYPPYTAPEWDQRPDWMRTGPWPSRYHVDEMLDGFTRDGYQRPTGKL